MEDAPRRRSKRSGAKRAVKRAPPQAASLRSATPPPDAAEAPDHRSEAVQRANRLAARAIAVANALADPSTPDDVVRHACAWVERVHALDGDARSKAVWIALVEAVEEVLAIRRRLSVGRTEADPTRVEPPPPSLKALANWVPAKVGARVPWAAYVDWLHQNTEAIERTLAACEHDLDWRALHELARECGGRPSDWKAMKSHYGRRGKGKGKRQSAL